MCRLCWTVLMLLLLAIVGAAYKFGIRGSTAPAEDGRLAILLTDGERARVLSEMRAFLVAVQAIAEAAANDKPGDAAAAARKVGMAAQRGVPVALMAKLPLEFKRLGLSTHRAFDQLALDAEQLGDRDHTLNQLAKLMRNCVGCHAAYRLGVRGVADRPRSQG